MDLNATIDLIIKDLTEAGEIIEDLKKYPGVPALQAELARLKCKSAGEVISMLKTMHPSVSQDPEVKKPVIPEPSEAKRQERIPSQAADKPEKIAAVVEEIKAVREDQKKHTAVKEQETGIVADRFSHPESFNEQIGTMKNEEDLSDILTSKPITALSDAIGLNDKFLFVREIFNGNLNDYDQAISRLDNTDNMADARAVIMSYTGVNSENESIRQLLDLVKRKLHSNE